MIIEATTLALDSLEKVNLILQAPVLSQKDIEKGKKIVTDLVPDVQKFNSLVESLKNARLQNDVIDNDQLSEIINALNIIIKKCIKIRKLIIIAAQMHVKNMEIEGYVGDENV